jgi:Asp-tRNA(Asn)/Glu-tRNA(Gln) amidotransferase A subunit family amidase
LGNLLGWPCVVLPTGFGERGLPTSMQFVGRPGSERALLALARHYQQHTDWHTRRPPGV